MVRTLKDVGPYSEYTYVDYLLEDWSLEDIINYWTTRVARWANPSYPPTPANPFSPGDPWTNVNAETITSWYNKEFRRYFEYVNNPYRPVRGNQQWVTVVWEYIDPNVPYYFIWTDPNSYDFMVYKTLMTYGNAQGWAMPSGFHIPHCAEYLALDVYFARYSLNFYDFIDNCYSWRMQNFPWITSDTIDSEYFYNDHNTRVWIDAQYWSNQRWDQIPNNNQQYFAVLPISDEAYGLSSPYVSIFGNTSLNVDMSDPYSAHIPVFLTEDASIMTYNYEVPNWYLQMSLFSSGASEIMNSTAQYPYSMIQRLWLTLNVNGNRYEIRESDLLIYGNPVQETIARVIVTVRYSQGRMFFEVWFLDSNNNYLDITSWLSFNYYNDRFVWVPNGFSAPRQTITWSITTSYY